MDRVFVRCEAVLGAVVKACCSCWMRAAARLGGDSFVPRLTGGGEG